MEVREGVGLGVLGVPVIWGGVRQRGAEDDPKDFSPGHRKDGLPFPATGEP